VQTKDDGTHVILPAAAHLRVRSDRAGLPVMWLRHANGKMRRDGSHAAGTQPRHAVDERGRLHGAPELSMQAALLTVANDRKCLTSRTERRQWLRSRNYPDRLRLQDKSRKLRRGRVVEELRCIKQFARCAPDRRSLSICTTHCTFTTTRASCTLAP
jgi:hypothetical protein